MRNHISSSCALSSDDAKVSAWSLAARLKSTPAPVRERRRPQTFLTRLSNKDELGRRCQLRVMTPFPFNAESSSEEPTSNSCGRFPAAVNQ